MPPLPQAPESRASSPRERRHRTSILLFLLCTWVTAIIFWPAAWSPDTISQLEQARSGRFNSHHPPLMAAFLRPFALLSAEKAVILVQVVAYWGMVWLLFSAFRDRPMAQRLRASIPVVLPSSIALIGIIWKDVHLALAWGLAWTLILLARRSHRPRHGLLWLAVPLIVYGVSVRHNAFLAVAPSILFLAVGRPWLKGAARTAGAYVGITLAALLMTQGLNRSMAAEDDVPTAELSLPIFDLAGISSHAQRNAFPFAMSDRQLRQVRQCYRPVRWDSLYFQQSPCAWLMAEMLAYQAQGGSVRSAWLHAIAQHPEAYLHHRAGFVRSFLTYEHEPDRITHRAEYNFAPEADLANPPVMLIGAYLSAMSLWEKLGLLSPLVAVAWAALLLWHCRGQASLPAIATAVFTALLNMASHLPFGVASDQRYSYPSFVLLALATSAFLLMRRVQPDGTQRVQDRQ